MFSRSKKSVLKAVIIIGQSSGKLKRITYISEKVDYCIHNPLDQTLKELTPLEFQGRDLFEEDVCRYKKTTVLCMNQRQEVRTL